jgi:hypothetical protein
MQMCHPQDPQNCDYLLVVTELQLLRPPTWPACQTKHTGHEGDHIRYVYAVVVAADVLHRRYDHLDRRTSQTTIRQCVMP